ncbi:MAG: sigma 54-interacting transcriptional regulator [Myxococcales bacterium]
MDFARGEQCDDGNQRPGDGCSATCRLEVCGNRFTDPGEACDDGNLVSGDRCSADCLSTEYCGNGYLDPVRGEEQCDDGLACSDGAPCACPVGAEKRCLDLVACSHLASKVCSPHSKDGCSSQCQLELARWTELPNSPLDRLWPAMAYDELRRRTVIFGGERFAPLADTWEYDGDTWVETSPAASPPARREARMVYDSARRRMVLFGGSSAGYLGDTWEFDGYRWTRVTPASSPAARSGYMMSYDPVRQRTVLFGGRNGSGALGDTWEFDGATWTQVASTGPAARWWGAMAYDAARGRTVLHGGQPMTGLFGDTWAWTGSSWVRLNDGTSGSPSARSRQALAYSSARGAVVLFGGYTNYEQADTWVLGASTWSQLTTGAAPANRSMHQMVFDSGRGALVLQGGLAPGGTRLGDTWELPDGSATWQEHFGPGDRSPLPRYRHAMVFDAGRGRAVLFGGDPLTAPMQNDTWEHDGRHWRRNKAADLTAPSARREHAMAYDSVRGRTLVFGGWTGTGSSQELCAFDGARWACSVPANSPEARSGHAMTFDPLRGRAVVFGGQGDSGWLGDLWEWDGSAWSKRCDGVPASDLCSAQPVARRAPSLAFDRARGTVILYGGLDAGFLRLDDVWSWDGTDWTRLDVDPSLATGRRDASLVYDEVRHRLILYGGTGGVIGTDTLFEDALELGPQPCPATPHAHPGLAAGAGLRLPASRSSTPRRRLGLVARSGPLLWRTRPVFDAGRPVEAELPVGDGGRGLPGRARQRPGLRHRLCGLGLRGPRLLHEPVRRRDQRAGVRRRNARLLRLGLVREQRLPLRARGAGLLGDGVGRTTRRDHARLQLLDGRSAQVQRHGLGLLRLAGDRRGHLPGRADAGVRRGERPARQHLRPVAGVRPGDCEPGGVPGRVRERRDGRHAVLRALAPPPSPSLTDCPERARIARGAGEESPSARCDLRRDTGIRASREKCLTLPSLNRAATSHPVVSCRRSPGQRAGFSPEPCVRSPLPSRPTATGRRKRGWLAALTPVSIDAKGLTAEEASKMARDKSGRGWVDATKPMQTLPDPIVEAPYHRVPRAARVCRDGQGEVVMPLHADRTYTLGRAQDADIVFTGNHVSRYHGLLALKDERCWTFRDMGSVNGTVLVRPDGSRQQVKGAEVPVQAGDVLYFAHADTADKVELLADESRTRLGPGWRSKASRQLEEFITISSGHELAIVLLGDSGTGKTWVARQIHDRSGCTGNFAAINCGRLGNEHNELHSELLGHVKGAYTGAVTDRVGKIPFAEDGTLFLDEVESMRRSAQDFLIDVLDRRTEITPLGAPPTARRPVPRFRLISASKIPLAETGLRQDLVQRLAVGQVFKLPRLEDRSEDIPALVSSFLHEAKATWGIEGSFAPDAMELLSTRAWPGQLRELRATCEALVQTASARAKLRGNPGSLVKVLLADLEEYLDQRAKVLGSPGGATPTSALAAAGGLPLAPARKRPADLTEEEIRTAFTRNQFKKQRTADELGIALNTLKALMKKFSIAG